MLSKKMSKALNNHMTYEFQSWYQYAAMMAYFEDMSLMGFANWMHVQAQEEMAHAMKFYRFIADSDAKVEFGPLEKPKQGYGTVLEAFEEVLKHEQSVTKRIHALADLAIEEHDHATLQFLQWFIAEQVEEEATVGEVVAQVRFVKEDASALFMIDRELAKRSIESGLGVNISSAPGGD
jgi:ferritin